MKTTRPLADELRKSLEELNETTITQRFETDIDNNVSPQEKPFTGPRKVRRSIEGKWREINPDLLLKICSSKFSLSESRIILYILWNITSSKSRNFIITTKKKIQDKTGLSQSQVSKSLKNLIEKQVISQDEENKNKYHFNPQFDIWFKCYELRNGHSDNG